MNEASPERARRILDISQPVDPSSGVFPGDTPFHFEWKWDQSKGDSCNVSAVTLSPHVGTHADAPLHFEADGADIGAVDLRRYVGPCIVVDGPVDGLVLPEHLESVDLESTPRILLRTHGSTDTAFPENFVALGAEAARWLGQRGCLLVGLDTPSMDPPASQELAAHRELARQNIAILENLVLAHVDPGVYELVALPLRWAGLDAAPVRAILLQ